MKLSLPQLTKLITEAITSFANPSEEGVFLLQTPLEGTKNEFKTVAAYKSMTDAKKAKALLQQKYGSSSELLIKHMKFNQLYR